MQAKKAFGASTRGTVVLGSVDIAGLVCPPIIIVHAANVDYPPT